MPSSRFFSAAIRLLICCFMLAICLRTWIIMGLIEPVHVAGSSMVPTLKGTHITPRCPTCNHQHHVGAEFAASVETLTCPQCGSSVFSADSYPLRSGDRLWIDRTTHSWRQLKRGELVVMRNPHHADELCIKRVAGLPGEQIALRDGNVVVNGEAISRKHATGHSVRRLIHQENQTSCRWQSPPGSAWNWQQDKWQINSAASEEIEWLRYQHPGARPITDDEPYNAGLSRQLNLVDEFILATEVRLAGDGALTLLIEDGAYSARITLELPVGTLTFMDSGGQSQSEQLMPDTIQQFMNDRVQLEISNFDQQFSFSMNQQILLHRRWPGARAAGTSQPVAIGVRGLQAEIGVLRLFTDIYYTTHAVGTPPPAEAVWQLKSDEYFLLGDNSPISLDSRLWGPVPAKLIIGRPILRGR